MSERNAIRVSDEAFEAIKNVMMERGLQQGEAADWLVLKGLKKWTAETKYQTEHGKPAAKPRVKKSPKAKKPRAKKDAVEALSDDPNVAAAQKLKAGGMLNTDIAEKLGLSKDQVYRLLKK